MVNRRRTRSKTPYVGKKEKKRQLRDQKKADKKERKRQRLLQQELNQPSDWLDARSETDLSQPDDDWEVANDPPCTICGQHGDEDNPIRWPCRCTGTWAFHYPCMVQYITQGTPIDSWCHYCYEPTTTDDGRPARLYHRFKWAERVTRYRGPPPDVLTPEEFTQRGYGGNYDQYLAWYDFVYANPDDLPVHAIRFGDYPDPGSPDVWFNVELGRWLGDDELDDYIIAEWEGSKIVPLDEID